MGITDAARDKARAKVSELEAEVTALKADLADAQDQLTASQATGDLLDSVKQTPVVGGLTEGMRRDSGVDQATAQANVDALKSKLSAAQTKLDWAKKAEDALGTVTGEG
jgi:hypothetical protein